MKKNDGVNIELIVNESLDNLSDNRKSAFESKRVKTYCQQRRLNSKSFNVWVFAEIKEENVCFGFLENGYDGHDIRWGLMFLDNDDLGDSGAWYNKLEELIDDCGYFDHLDTI